MFKVNNRNTRIRCKICSKLTIKIIERRIIPERHVVLVSLLLTLKKISRLCSPQPKIFVKFGLLRIETNSEKVKKINKQKITNNLKILKSLSLFLT